MRNIKPSLCFTLFMATLLVAGPGHGKELNKSAIDNLISSWPAIDAWLTRHGDPLDVEISGLQAPDADRIDTIIKRKDLQNSADTLLTNSPYRSLGDYFAMLNQAESAALAVKLEQHDIKLCKNGHFQSNEQELIKLMKVDQPEMDDLQLAVSLGFTLQFMTPKLESACQASQNDKVAVSDYVDVFLSDNE